jgi:hypothetical protein
VELHDSACERKLDTAGFVETTPENQNSKICERCGEAFVPRLKSGGSPQRFCSQDCRLAFHSKPQRGQRSPACSALPAVIDPLEPKSPSDAPGANSDFDWNNDTECVVLAEQRQTAVYWNPSGDLVIRQRAWPDEDPYVVISKSSLDEFIDKLCDVAGVPSVGTP